MIRLPLAQAPLTAAGAEHAIGDPVNRNGDAGVAAQTSTTTGSTIGRRRRRS